MYQFQLQEHTPPWLLTYSIKDGKRLGSTETGTQDLVVQGQQKPNSRVSSVCKEWLLTTGVVMLRESQHNWGGALWGIQVSPLMDGEVQGGDVAVQGSALGLPGGWSRCQGFWASIIAPTIKSMPEY